MEGLSQTTKHAGCMDLRLDARPPRERRHPAPERVGVEAGRDTAEELRDGARGGDPGAGCSTGTGNVHVAGEPVPKIGVSKWGSADARYRDRWGRQYYPRQFCCYRALGDGGG
jgi:hypothetical protein